MSSTPIEDDRPACDPATRPRVRDRIFDTACDLFYRHGIRAVGIDAIVGAAGTNKMSFYRSFASKDELVADYLRWKDDNFWRWWEAVVAPHAGQPRAQVEALFEAHVNKTCSKKSRGCGLANAAVELVDDEHPGREIVIAHKSEIRSRFRALAVAMRAREPALLGDALMLLMEGGYVARLTFPKGGPTASALHAARTLMDAHGT